MVQSRREMRGTGGLLLLLLLAPGVMANMRADNMALRTSLAPTQQMQESYQASQQAAEQQEEQYVQQQQNFEQQENTQYTAPAQVLQEPAEQQYYPEPGEVPQEVAYAPAPAPSPAPAEPWPASSYNTGEPLVTTQTEEDART